MKKNLKRGKKKLVKWLCHLAWVYANHFDLTNFFLTVWWERSFFPTWAKMAMSGVELEAECKTVYDEVQSKKKHRYVTFMIADGKIKVDKVIKRISQLVTSKIVFICHTIRKVKYLSKNSILTKPQHFHEFFTQIFFLTIFLVKSKLSTAKKYKTTTFSRV